MAYARMTAAKTYGGAALTMETGQAAAAQSFKAGALLVNSSGRVAKAAADPTLGSIVGVSDMPADGTTDQAITFVPAVPTHIFEANLDDGTGTYALVQTDVNKLYGIALDAGTDDFYLDQGETTNVRVCITALKDAVATVNGRVYFVFLPLATVTGRAAV